MDVVFAVLESRRIQVDVELDVLVTRFSRVYVGFGGLVARSSWVDVVFDVFLKLTQFTGCRFFCFGES